MKNKIFSAVLSVLLVGYVLVSLTACAENKAPENLKNAKEAYVKAIEDAQNSDEDVLHNSNNMRFALGFVNEDDIPELFVCYGTGGIDAVSIYSYDTDSDAVNKWGDFSSRGWIKYYEKQGIVVSQYGNNGYFPHVFERIEGGERKIILEEAQYLDDDGGVHYNIVCPTDGTSSNESGELYDNEVSEEEYLSVYNDLIGNLNNDILLEYDNMTLYSAEAFGSEMNEICGLTSD